jgi:homoserine acetyltransferase
MPSARYWELQSPHGHDAFLLESAQLAEQVKGFLEQYR